MRLSAAAAVRNLTNLHDACYFAEAVKPEHQLANGNAEAKPASEGVKPEPAAEDEKKAKLAVADGPTADGDTKASSGDAETEGKVRVIFTRHAECISVACIADCHWQGTRPVTTSIKCLLAIRR